MVSIQKVQPSKIDKYDLNIDFGKETSQTINNSMIRNIRFDAVLPKLSNHKWVPHVKYSIIKSVKLIFEEKVISEIDGEYLYIMGDKKDEPSDKISISLKLFKCYDGHMISDKFKSTYFRVVIVLKDLHRLIEGIDIPDVHLKDCKLLVDTNMVYLMHTHMPNRKYMSNNNIDISNCDVYLNYIMKKWHSQCILSLNNDIINIITDYLTREIIISIEGSIDSNMICVVKSTDTFGVYDDILECCRSIENVDLKDLFMLRPCGGGPKIFIKRDGVFYNDTAYLYPSGSPGNFSRMDQTISLVPSVIPKYTPPQTKLAIQVNKHYKERNINIKVYEKLH
jgi:hypothetical protein